MSLKGRTYWIVGASEGLGRALAIELDRRGVDLILSARNAERLHDLASELSRPPRILPMDVTDVGSVSGAVTAASDAHGVIYMAGYYEPMRAQDWDASAAERMIDVNFAGAMRVLGRFVPHLIDRDAGHVVIIGSLAGYRGLPGAIGYGAGKAAIMHLAETMRSDLWRSGVKVQLVNPGFVRTRLTDKNDFAMPFLMEAGSAAVHVADAMESRKFKTDFPWVFSMFFRAGRLLPQGLFQRLFASGKRH